jgi:hypothetical protein
MPVANSGNILFSSLVGKAEGTAGTSPSFASGGRKFLVEPTGLITLGQTFDLGETRSVSFRTPIIAGASTLLSVEPELSVSVPAVSIDELSVWLSMSTTPVATAGTVAPYVYTYDWAMGTAQNTPISYSFISMDAQGGTAAGGNAYLLNYCLPTTLGIAADRAGLTSLSASMFAQNVAVSTAVPAASTAVPTSKFLSGRLWQVATGTALATGTFTSYNYALDFDLSINTGIVRQAYLSGTTVFSTHAESDPFGGEISLTVQSNKAANDAWFAKLGQQQYVRLSWTDGTYSATIYLSIIVSEVQPISGSEDGLTTMAITGTLAYDATSGKTIQVVIGNSLATLA